MRKKLVIGIVIMFAIVLSACSVVKPYRYLESHKTSTQAKTSPISLGHTVPLPQSLMNRYD